MAGSPADRLRDFLEEVLAACDLDADVEVEESDEALSADIDGDDLGLLIGRHGQTIEALEHLGHRIAYQGSSERKRVQVEIAGYRARRAEILKREADRAAADAVRYGRPVALDAMAATERRIVHEYLRDNPEVETHSEGDEPDRHLVVAPIVS
jgi:spoIIIJ-associated protein